MKLPISFGKLKTRTSKLLIVRRVVGDSMTPALEPGRLVVAVPWLGISNGDVVIVRHEGLEKIKRVDKKRGGQLYIIGDNADYSTDSRQFGWVSEDIVAGKIIWPRV